MEDRFWAEAVDCGLWRDASKGFEILGMKFLKLAREVADVEKGEEDE